MPCPNAGLPVSMAREGIKATSLRSPHPHKGSGGSCTSIKSCITRSKINPHLQVRPDVDSVAAKSTKLVIQKTSIGSSADIGTPGPTARVGAQPAVSQVFLKLPIVLKVSY